MRVSGGGTPANLRGTWGYLSLEGVTTRTLVKSGPSSSKDTVVETAR